MVGQKRGAADLKQQKDEAEPSTKKQKTEV